MRHGGHVFDERDFQANGLQRANGRFPAGPRSLDPHLNLFHTVGHGLAGGILRHKGWRAASVQLPPLNLRQDLTVIAPAEIEIE